ncbi:secreted RxLR effector protein 161-like [Solanum verrucosum]|uniref:secreted RxLR effector protein 161-like n=1 Tax=Solanum verrucosum TaxID=315347 RepID=UPI0020D0E57F|nr:secreted RxLR effector protein 161-like [Solanum verrucosum]
MKLTTASEGTCGEEELYHDVSQYQRLIGKILYLTITRPDIAYTVQTLNQFLQRPKVQHWQAALRVLRYHKNQPGLGLLMSSQKNMKLTGFCDSDWVACPNTRRSVTGYLLKLGDYLISWKSKKQPTVSRSSAEAEYKSLACLTAEIVWVTNLFKELGINVKEPVAVFCDNKAAIQIVEIDCHFIREKIQQGLISTIYIPTGDQQADILTKALGKLQHDFLLSKLGVLNVFTTPSLRRSIEDNVDRGVT